ncbi:hypothetical protein R80B4_02422 [Fibrobacteres bacterium R8-0-B4]
MSETYFRTISIKYGATGGRYILGLATTGSSETALQASAPMNLAATIAFNTELRRAAECSMFSGLSGLWCSGSWMVPASTAHSFRVRSPTFLL